jgi:hypothetical protein
VLRSTRSSQLFPVLVTVALCSLSVLSAGCGPFGYLKKVARESSRSVAKAEAAGAEENAPYEYWGSVTYLEQSKILMGYSEYERSFDYGERAKQLAEEATKKAEMRRKGQMEQRSDALATPDELPKDGAAPAGAAGAAGTAPAAPAGSATGTATGTAGGGEVKAGVSVGGGK